MKIRKWWHRRRQRKNIDTLDSEVRWWKAAARELHAACTELSLDPDNVRRQVAAIRRKKYVNHCISFGYDKAEGKLRILLAEELAENPPCGDE